MNGNFINRKSYIDQVSGVLILYMILYHILQWSGLKYVIDSYWMYPLSFFMFWFFYKSGMFYRQKTFKSKLTEGGEIVGSISCF